MQNRRPTMWTFNRPSKHGAKKTRVDGITFDSIKEANYYEQLKMAKKVGMVHHFHRQLLFDLPGGTTSKIDFQIFYADGTIRYVDVKSKHTVTLKEWRRSKKQIEALYDVLIEEEI